MVATKNPTVREVSSNDSGALNPELLESATPWVIRGLASQWPMVSSACSSNQEVVNYLRTFATKQPVQAFVAAADNQGRYFYDDELNGFNFTVKTVDFPEVLQDIHDKSTRSKGDTVYMGSTPIDHILPGLRKHNEIAELANSPLVNIWIGNQSRIAAHFDALDNLAVVVAGRRRFTLFPPEQLKNLYVGPLDFTPAGQAASLVDMREPDLDRFPKFRTALEHAQLAELAPGDAVYIPAMWWHHVEGLDSLNILVNYWWRKAGLHLGAPHDALFHALLSLKDLPAEQRAAWRTIFDYYVFGESDLSHIPESRKGVLGPIDDRLAQQLRALLLDRLKQ